MRWNETVSVVIRILHYTSRTQPFEDTGLLGIGSLAHAHELNALNGERVPFAGCATLSALVVVRGCHYVQADSDAGTRSESFSDGSWFLQKRHDPVVNTDQNSDGLLISF